MIKHFSNDKIDLICISFKYILALQRPFFHCYSGEAASSDDEVAEQTKGEYNNHNYLANHFLSNVWQWNMS